MTAEKYEREWYRAIGGQVITEIVNRAGVEVKTNFSPVQGGYGWESGPYSSECTCSEPYEALMHFIVWRMQKSISITKVREGQKASAGMLMENYVIDKSLIFDQIHIEQNSHSEYVFVLEGVESDESYLTEELAFVAAISELIKENKRLEKVLERAVEEELGLE